LIIYFQHERSKVEINILLPNVVILSTQKQLTLD
jgi:hypothetical protein